MFETANLVLHPLTHSQLLKYIQADGSLESELGLSGEVELGYGTYDEFQNKGFMTEAIGGIIAWAQHQPEIKTIFANTDTGNISSLRVLEKNGFTQAGVVDSLVKLRLMVRDM